MKTADEYFTPPKYGRKFIPTRLFSEVSNSAGFWRNAFGSHCVLEILIPPKAESVGLDGIFKKVKLLFPPICPSDW